MRLIFAVFLALINQLAYAENVSINLLGKQVEKVTQLTNQLDLAKEKATNCRYLAILSDGNGKSILNKDANKDILIKSLLPNMASDCYESLNLIANRTMEQLGANVTHATFNSLNRTRSDYDFNTEGSSPEPKSRDFYRNDQRDLITREGFLNGSDYCSHFSVGVLADLAEFINQDCFEVLSRILPEQSALSSLANLEKLNQLEVQHSGKNISIYQMLQFVKRCKQKRPISDTNGLVDKLFRLLSQSSECKWSDVFTLQQLYSISNTRQRSLELAKQTHSILGSCLADLERANTKNDVISFSQTERFKPFTQKLINYLTKKFFHGSANILDAINPRSFMNNNIEMALFFNQELHAELTKAGQDLSQFYIDGKGICDSLIKKRIFSSDTIPRWLPDHMDKISLILGIESIQLNLKLEGEEPSFHYALIWNMCQSIKLFPIQINEPTKLLV